MADVPGKQVVCVESELLDLVRLYIANRARDVERIGAALDRQDFEMLRRLAHNMLGSGRTFGFDTLTDIGGELQRAVTRADRAEIMRVQARLAAFVSGIEVRSERRGRSRRRPRQAKVGPGAAPVGTRKPCVMVVDDQEMNRLIIKRYLEKEGYAVRQAGSGDEAIALLAQGPAPVLVLLDVLMAGLDGFEACRRIKSDPRTQAIPVVLVTGFELPQYRSRGLASGADAFLSKPVHREQLLASVRALARIAPAAPPLESELSRTTL